MSDIDSRLEAARGRAIVLVGGLAVLLLCAAGQAPRCFAQSSSEATFASADQAGNALAAAVQAGDEQAMLRILGGDKQLVSSGDEAQDQLDRERFTRKYAQMHRLVREDDGTVRLYVGAENWPFPVPLVSNHGAWYFDAQAGVQEVMLRRIGENELGTMRACHALALARSAGEPSMQDPSESSMQDPGEPSIQHSSDPVTVLLANMRGSGAPGAFRGYYFQRLESARTKAPARTADQAAARNAPKGFAFVAYPAEYRRSGVMTFVVDPSGGVYQKDLGPDTAAIARTLTWPMRDPTWSRVQVSPAS